jgi:hypothetical protein
LSDVFTKLENVQATQLKCITDGKITAARDQKIGSKGQNDNDHQIPETKPDTSMTTELSYKKGTQRN